jgi:signal transduction histidine kinase
LSTRIAIVRKQRSPIIAAVSTFLAFGWMGLVVPPQAFPWLIAAAGVLVGGLLFAVLRMRATAHERSQALLEARAGLHSAEAQTRELARGLERRVLDQTTALLERNQELRNFGRFLSHELRQPIGSMSLFAQLLAEQEGQRLSDAGRRHVAMIVEGAKQLGAMIESQLMLTAGEPVTEEEIPLDEVVEKAAELLEKDLADVGATLSVESLPRVSGHRASLAQVFHNLIANSIKHRRQDLPLVIRIRTHASGAEGVEIEVSDNGCGFDADSAERISDPGQRLAPHSAETEGLGLAIARRILERSGGRLWAEGTSGAGTRFRVWLPAGPRSGA